jgi:hypothetical protein
MARILHEEHDKEDPKVSLFTRLEQSIDELIEMITQLLVMKGKETHSMDIEHGEHKASLEDYKSDKLGNSSNDNTFSSSSSIPFKVELKLEIPKFDDQVNT